MLFDYSCYAWEMGFVHVVPRINASFGQPYSSRYRCCGTTHVTLTTVRKCAQPAVRAHLHYAPSFVGLNAMFGNCAVRFSGQVNRSMLKIGVSVKPL